MKFFIWTLIVTGTAFSAPMDYVCETYVYAAFPPTYQSIIGKKDVLIDFSVKKQRVLLTVEKNSMGNLLPFQIVVETENIQKNAIKPKLPLQVSTYKEGYYLSSFGLAESMPIHITQMVNSQIYYLYCNPK